MTTEIEIECPLNVHLIAARVAANKEAFEKKIQKCMVKQNHYEKTCQYVSEV